MTYSKEKILECMSDMKLANIEFAELYKKSKSKRKKLLYTHLITGLNLAYCILNILVIGTNKTEGK